MNKVWWLFAILLFLILAKPTFAHQLKIDGSMGVTIHIDPDDEPRAGTESKIYVTFEDSSGRFNPANPSNCICTLTIFSGEQQVVQLPVVNGGAYAQLRYTFPTSGKYTAVVEGKPTGEGQRFGAFKTSYEYYVRGDGVVIDQNPLSVYIPYVEATIGAGIVWMFMRVPAQQKTKKKN
jgi:hypothetical protein